MYTYLHMETSIISHRPARVAIVNKLLVSFQGKSPFHRVINRASWPHLVLCLESPLGFWNRPNPPTSKKGLGAVAILIYDPKNISYQIIVWSKHCLYLDKMDFWQELSAKVVVCLLSFPASPSHGATFRSAPL